MKRERAEPPWYRGAGASFWDRMRSNMPFGHEQAEKDQWALRWLFDREDGKVWRRC